MKIAAKLAKSTEQNRRLINCGGDQNTFEVIPFVCCQMKQMDSRFVDKTLKSDHNMNIYK